MKIKTKRHEVKVFIGSTSKKKRFRLWKFERVDGRIQHGFTIFLWDEKCISIQWR